MLHKYLPHEYINEKSRKPRSRSLMINIGLRGRGRECVEKVIVIKKLKQGFGEKLILTLSILKISNSFRLIINILNTSYNFYTDKFLIGPTFTA